MRPIAGADIVACTYIKSSRRSKKSVNSAKIGPLCAPTEDERLIIRVRQSATTADSPIHIRGERVVGDRDCGGHGKKCSADKVDISFTDPHQGIHVHHHGVLTCGEHLAIRTLRLIPGIKQKLINVGEPRLGRDPGVGCAHSEWVYAPDLGDNRQGHGADQSEEPKWRGARPVNTLLHAPRRTPSASD